METYNIFLDYYDKIVRWINSPLEEEVDFLDTLIKKHNYNSKTILETACWTWVVAREFQNIWYDITWLDINENMLKKAQNLISKDKLILWDMTNFDLKQKFDVVLCNYNSICHLLNWEDWVKFFEMANNHLDKDGIFIFDINTIFEFENITREFSQFYNFWDDVVCLEMEKENNIYKWIIKIFKKIDDGKYELIVETVKEISFDINEIKKELKNKWFKIMETLDFHYWNVNSKSERVYFVCKKR